MTTVRTIDAHAAGEPLRLIVDGFPAPQGRTMLEKREWVRKKHDHLRRALMLEPRGHADMYGAVLTEPVAPGSQAGVLVVPHEGDSTVCGHGVIAVTTIALERGLTMPASVRSADIGVAEAASPKPTTRAEAGPAIVYDTPAGTVRARAMQSGSRVASVAFVNVP